MSDDKITLCFEFCDHEERGKIQKKDILNYMTTHEFTEKEIKDVSTKFDIHDGSRFDEISYEEFFIHLGHEKAPERRKEHRDGVTVLSENMPLAYQFKCEEIVDECLDKYPTNKEVAKGIKAMLDKRMERLWHVVIVKGQYWAYYSHEPNYSYVFSYKNHIYILWRTPGY